MKNPERNNTHWHTLLVSSQPSLSLWVIPNSDTFLKPQVRITYVLKVNIYLRYSACTLHYAFKAESCFDSIPSVTNFKNI